MQLFNPLNGKEVKDIILADLARTLDADTELQQHIAFPRISWKWKLEMRIYPRTPEEKVVETAGIAVQVHEKTGEPVVSEAAPHTREVYTSPEREVLAPDQVRESVGLPIPTQKSAMSPFMGRSNRPNIEVGKAAQNPTSMPKQVPSET